MTDSFKILIVGGMLALMCGPIAGSFWLLPALKRRVTWPRTGYVAPRQRESKSYWVPFVLLPLVVALPFVPPPLVLPLTGLLFAAISALMGRAMQLRRAYFLGALLCAFGIALGFARVPVETGMGILFGVAGVVTLFSGGWTLYSYLRQA